MTLKTVDLPAWNVKAQIGTAALNPRTIRSLSTGFSTYNNNPPSAPIITGMVMVGTAPAKRRVWLRTKAGHRIASTYSDVTTGLFEFRLWLPKRDDYEIEVIGQDYQTKIWLIESSFALWYSGTARLGSKAIEFIGTIPAMTVGVAVVANITLTGGTSPYTLVSSTLPAGVSANLSGSVIALSGTPTTAGTVQGSLKVSDSNGFFTVFGQAIIVS